MENDDREWFDKLGEDIRCEKVTTEVFQRLHTLVKKGYVPDFHMEFVKAFWLSHLSKNFKHNALILYPSGLVISSNENTDEFRFGLEDEHEFQRFLLKVPSPTVWDRARTPLLNIWAIIVVYGGLLIFGLAFAYSIDAIWSFIKRAFAS
jgi:hypothetical protein